MVKNSSENTIWNFDYYWLKLACAIRYVYYEEALAPKRWKLLDQNIKVI